MKCEWKMRPSNDFDDDKIVQSREINKQLTIIKSISRRRNIAKVCNDEQYGLVLVCTVRTYSCSTLHIQLKATTHAQKLSQCRNKIEPKSRTNCKMSQWANIIQIHTCLHTRTHTVTLQYHLWLTVAHFNLPSSNFEMSPNQCSIYTRTHAHSFELGTHTNVHASMS